jgi:hypothetical protein
MSLTRQVFGVGSAANDGTGDTLRAAFIKQQDNNTVLFDASNSFLTMLEQIGFFRTGEFSFVSGVGQTIETTGMKFTAVNADATLSQVNTVASSPLIFNAMSIFDGSDITGLMSTNPPQISSNQYIHGSTGAITTLPSGNKILHQLWVNTTTGAYKVVYGADPESSVANLQKRKATEYDRAKALVALAGHFFVGFIAVSEGETDFSSNADCLTYMGTEFGTVSEGASSGSSASIIPTATDASRDALTNQDVGDGQFIMVSASATEGGGPQLWSVETTGATFAAMVKIKIFPQASSSTYTELADSTARLALPTSIGQFVKQADNDEVLFFQRTSPSALSSSWLKILLKDVSTFANTTSSFANSTTSFANTQS